MVGPPSLSDRGQPQDGDVVVVSHSSSDHLWSVLRHPGPPQIAAKSRPGAISIARSAATELGVDVWSLEAGAYALLETHRGTKGRRDRQGLRAAAEECSGDLSTVLVDDQRRT